MNFAKLMQAQVTLMKALFDAAQAENRDFSEEEQTKYDAAKAEYKRLEKAKAEADELAAMQDSIVVEPVNEPAPNSQAHAAAGDDRAAKKPYNTIGHMMVDVYKAKMGEDDKASERLRNATGLNTNTGSEGGFLVPPEFIAGKMEQAIYQSQLASRCSEFNTSRNAVEFPQVDEQSRADGSRFGGVSTSWLNEGGSLTVSKPKFRLAELKLGKLGSFVVATEEMIEDAPFLTSWVNTMFASDMAFTLDQAIFDGDGNGKPLGFMNSNALVTVAKEGSQTADTIVYENVVKMWSRMPAYRYGRAVWLIDQAALPQLPLMNLSVGTGGAPVFLPAAGASDAPYSTLLGRPIVPIEQAAALGDLGDIALVDLSDYMLVSKGGMKSDSSIHVYFDTDEMCWRFIKRVNGMAMTYSAVQSRSNSSFTTSPYITLAARA